MRGSTCQSTDFVPLRDKKNCSEHAHKQNSGTLIGGSTVGVVFKISYDHPRHFIWESPSPPGVSACQIMTSRSLARVIHK